MNPIDEVRLSLNEMLHNSPIHNSESLDDIERKEMLWDEKNQELILNWCIQSEQSSKLHGKAGKRNKVKYHMFSVPAIILPLIVSGLAPLFENHPMIVSCVMVIVSIFTGLTSFFSWQKKSQQHFEYEARYIELSNEIKKELIKKKRNRIAVDVYLERVCLEINKLNSSAPVL